MNDEYKDTILDALIASSIRQQAKEEIEKAPSDDELVKMFPLEKKHKEHLHYYSKLKKSSSSVRRPVVYLKRVAVIFLSIITVSFALLMTNTEVRAAVKRAVVEFFEQFVKINLSNSDSDKNEIIDIEKVGVNYIPKGFLLENYDITPDLKWFFYTDGGEGSINITINKSSDTEINVDNELTDYEKAEINGYEAYILYDESDQTGTVVFGDKNVTITVSAILEKSELLKIAENIK